MDSQARRGYYAAGNTKQVMAVTALSSHAKPSLFHHYRNVVDDGVDLLLGCLKHGHSGMPGIDGPDKGFLKRVNREALR